MLFGQESKETQRLNQLKQIYNEKFEQAYPLCSRYNSEQWLLSHPLGHLNCPITEQGLEEGIINLELKMQEEKERRRLLNY